MVSRIAAAMLVCLMLFSGCGVADSSSGATAPPAVSEPVSSSRSEVSSPVEDTGSPDEEAPAEPAYLDQLVAQTVAKFATPDMSEYEKAKAAFDYMIENTILDEPLGLELWRVHGGGDTPIPFLEQRALSPLRFGVGMCEDYAAAFTMLLRGMGLEAQYVPGLTYSAEGHWVDHAWVIAKIDGVWYHLDCQLEDNISRHGAIRYRYFMKSDATMAGSHRWGQNLIDSGFLTTEQNAELAQNYLYEPCPQDYPTPPRHTLEETIMPDIAAIQAEAAAEMAAYEQANGPLAPMELNRIPPVFGLDGYGPSDEG